MIERLSLNSLKYFYYVATYGSVTLAAQKLFVTQSAVSKQLKNLENDLGIDLFDRVNKKLNEYALSSVLEGLKIVSAELGNDGGIIGAAYLGMNE